MANKADVKAIMARFETNEASTDETTPTTVGRPKPALHPTLSSGPAIQKKPVLESLSGSAANVNLKPAFPKNTVSTKRYSDGPEPNKAKALTSRFTNNQDGTSTDSKPFTPNKLQTPFKSPVSQGLEAQGLGPKPPFNKLPLGANLSESKPKPPLGITSKPSWVKEETSVSAAQNTTLMPPKLPSVQQKPGSSFIKLQQQQSEEQAGANTNAAIKPSPPVNSFKPPSNFKTAQNMFKNETEKTEQTDSSSIIKSPLTANNSTPPPKPPASKKPSKKMPKVSPQTRNVNGDAPSGLKRKPLTNSLALGPAPAKPNRPPKVNLESFKRAAESSDGDPGFKKLPATPLTSHLSNHGNHMTPAPPPQTAGPSLPPRPPGTMNQQDDFYDDVDGLSNSNVPPPLPSSAVHPSQRPKKEENDDDIDDGEMYEDLDQHWGPAEQKQDKKKDDKEEKKRQEAEKKEQKEREKKENDARRKFKLVGPLEVLQKGKALIDCRSHKTDLALKQGDNVDIIRIHGNPEGKWLARSPDGSIGYVKTTSVEIDFNALKARPIQDCDPDVYDDVDVVSIDNSGIKGPGVVLPPLPGEGGEIYDDVVDPNLEVSPLDPRSSLTKPRSFLRMFERNRRTSSTKEVPPPSQFTAEGNSGQPGVINEEIYDDVDSQNPPLPPPISTLPGMRGKEMDPKKQKKFEKEEKEFKKKFKYEGEIQVLYQVTIDPSLTSKKWSGKDLPVKAGETLDVIVKPVNNKMICRNEDGKFGYVCVSYIVTDDGDIYDDIGDECIYDND
ncbi:FYN-binding protein 1 isoform 2-T2 [Pholidichthys leucotaenia]